MSWNDQSKKKCIWLRLNSDIPHSQLLRLRESIPRQGRQHCERSRGCLSCNLVFLVNTTNALQAIKLILCTETYKSLWSCVYGSLHHARDNKTRGSSHYSWMKRLIRQNKCHISKWIRLRKSVKFPNKKMSCSGLALYPQELFNGCHQSFFLFHYLHYIRELLKRSSLTLCIAASCTTAKWLCELLCEHFVQRHRSSALRWECNTYYAPTSSY